jgi:hypothetical protein
MNQTASPNNSGKGVTVKIFHKTPQTQLRGVAEKNKKRVAKTGFTLFQLLV